MRHWLTTGARALLALATFVAMGALFEVGLRRAGYEPIYDVYSKPSVLWRKDALLGWHHQPNHSEVYIGPRPWPVEFETPIEINALGLRGPEVQPVPEGGKRVLFLGDSVVAGFEVPYDQTFVDRVRAPLEARLGIPIQTINGGVRGYGTDQSMLYYRQRGRALRPDLVVFIHAINDVRNNMTLHRPRRPFGKAAFALEGAGAGLRLRLQGAPVPDYPLCSHWLLDEKFAVTRADGLLARSVCELETRLADRSALFTLVAFRLRQYPAFFHWLRTLGGSDSGPGPDADPSPAHGLGTFDPLAPLDWIGPRAAHAAPRRARPSREPRFALTGRILVDLARDVRESGAELLIVMREEDRVRIDQQAIRREGARLRTIPFPLEKLGDRAWRWVNDGHYNALGHELAAEVLAPAIERILAGKPAEAARDSEPPAD